MKAKIAAILAGIMLAVTCGTISASATVTSTIGQQDSTLEARQTS